MSVLEVDGLSVCFGGLTAVKDVCLDVKPGEIVSVIGPNGAGKTTVFNVITGVYDPTRGCIRIGGKSGARPFRVQTFAGIVLIAVLTAIGLLIAFNLQPIWVATINNNFIFQQAFPWGAAFKSFVAYFRALSPLALFMPLLLGSVVGASGAFAVWRRARSTPDVIAAAGIARTFQNPRLFHQMTVIENVLIGMDTKLRERFWDAALRLPLHRREGREKSAKAMELLEFAELASEADQLASSLSYGHQRRLEIARALASEPKLLLLDEPAAGMNPSESVELMELIRRIRDRGIAVMLIEHHMNIVMGISDRIAVLDYGNKIAEGTPDEIKANPLVRKAYLGADI